MAHSVPEFGNQLRLWRQRRRFSQLELACQAKISTRHLSFMETGRAAPSRDMVLTLAEELSIPLRERNVLLRTAGFAAVFSELPLSDDAMAAARRAVEFVLNGHDPYPALAVDRHWNMVAANSALGPLMSGVAPTLLTPPVNVLRLSLHKDGLASRIINLGQWRAHLLERLRRQCDASADPLMADLLRELSGFAAPDTHFGVEESTSVAVPLKLALDVGELSLLSTSMVFGAPSDLTLSELALEFFFPTDEITADILCRLARGRRE